MKSYTDLEQSKKLAEIFPLESADGFWPYHNKWCSEGDEWEGYEDYPKAEPYLEYTRKENEWKEDKSDVPAWSLAALLDVLPDELEEGYYLTLFKERKEYCCCFEDNNGDSFKHTFADNPIDACVEMILMLKELKKL